MTYPNEIECRDCQGHGTRLVPGCLDDAATCPACNGTGWRAMTLDEQDDSAERYTLCEGETPLSADLAVCRAHPNGEGSQPVELNLDTSALNASTTDIVAAVERDASVILLDPGAFEAYLIQLHADVSNLDQDVSVRKNREAIRTAAAEIARKKEAIDKSRLALTKDWRDKTAQANEAGKAIKTSMEALAAKVRQPLTEWEDAEKARVTECQNVIIELKSASIITMDDTSATVRERGKQVYQTVIDADRFGDLHAQAVDAKDAAVATLRAAMARLTQEEADKAELARLRAIQAERDEADRIAAEQAEADRIEADRVEELRVAAERAETDRLAQIEAEKDAARIAAERQAALVEQARKDAAEEAQRAAEKAAQDERDRIQREHDEALAAEKRRADELAKAEADRLAKESADAAELARRERNRAHRSKVMGEAKIAIMAASGIDEAAAITIVKAIVKGTVPHISIGF